MFTIDDVMREARMVGERAPVDAVPDPTGEGFGAWKEEMLTYFGCACDSFLSKYETYQERREDVLAAMKEGFTKLLLKQPYVEVPLQPMEKRPRMRELRIVEEVFEELESVPHHCTH
jgi:hypothetical protein